MLLKFISIVTVCFFTSAIGNAATTKSENLFNMALKNQKQLITQSRKISQNLIIYDNQLLLSQSLQTELASKIDNTQKCLDKLDSFLNKNIEPKIGLVYIHKGYDKWSLQFTYGGYLLNTETELIITTPKIFELKKIFANTKSLQIDNKNYQTTRYMNQLGPILHESEN